MPETSSNASPASAHSPRIVSIARSVALGASIAIITLLILVITKPNNRPETGSTTDTPTDSEGSENLDPSESPNDADDDAQPSNAPEFIDLQPTVDAWKKTTTADIGLMIYDLDNQRVAASYQADKVFNVASIYKLFFVYAGYRQIDSGALKPDAHFVTTEDYRAGNYTLSECLDLMIRESYNGCADPMRANSAFDDRAAAIIDELGLNNTSNLGLYSTAADLTKLLQLYYYHPDLSEDSWSKIANSMLDQPPTKVSENTVYDWRQGLPAGFSNEAKVYDKVGWEWDEDQWRVYADAAIVEFPNLNRHYTIVILSSGIRSQPPQAIINLGRQLEQAITTQSN